MDSFYFFNTFDRGNYNSEGLIVPKSKREGQDGRKPAVLRGILVCLGYSSPRARIEHPTYSAYKLTISPSQTVFECSNSVVLIYIEQ
jgi:Predicted acyl esterases